MTLPKCYFIHSAKIYGRSNQYMGRIDGVKLFVEGSLIGTIEYVEKASQKYIFNKICMFAKEVEVTAAPSKYLQLEEVMLFGNMFHQECVGK